MRRTTRLAGCLFGLALCCPLSRAGLYLPIEKDYQRLPANSREYRFLLDERQGLVPAYKIYEDDQKKPPEKRDKDLKISAYAKQVFKTKEALEEKRKGGPLTVDEAVSLSGYYLLLNQPELALPLMEETEKREPKNFMVLANLAMAYQGVRQLERAETYQSELVNTKPGGNRFVWPKKYEGWSKERLAWQLRVEEFFKTLLRQRLRAIAQLPPGVSPGTDLQLDNLFPGARFVGPGGVYTPGQTDTETQDALPPDAVAIVEQLVLWMPADNNLQWLLAEVCNARGETETAERVMSKLVNAGLSGEGLREHRRILEEYVTPKPPPPPDEPPWRPELRSVGVGLGIGFVVGMLVVFQLRQLARRKPQRSTV